MNTTGFKNPEFDGVSSQRESRNFIYYDFTNGEAEFNYTLLNHSVLMELFSQFSSSGVSARVMFRTFNEFAIGISKKVRMSCTLRFVHIIANIYYDLVPWNF